ncbi:MAG: flagellar hook-associated protein FlgK [Nitrospinae bacterium CG11_big_fil_rev_8_21_14_0_20_56_8]|nr:MAG: flagellar hook-associated protein FlgK [Nitrospinae bacterium CG11_big_fil_rev_8_21_14_0_20_56_8]
MSTSNIFSVLNTGRVGLLAQQLALEVTGQNVANVQTKGYSRQEVVFEANTPRMTAQGQLGTGVRVAGLNRIHDEFLFSQILAEGDTNGNYQVRKDVFDKLEVLFNETKGRSLNNQLSDFFASLQDLSTNPSGLPERANVVARGQELSTVFNQLGDGLFTIQRNLDNNVVAEAEEINALTARIAKLNKEIHENELPGQFGANDLRDTRDRLIRELSEKIDIKTVDEVNNQVNITLQGGLPLILGDTTFDLSTTLNGNNNSFRDVLISNSGGGTTNITSGIKGGKLKGYLDMRDTEVAQVKDTLERMAASFVREFNRVHQGGFGADGSTGVNFFKNLVPVVKTNVDNTGSAQVSMSNAAPGTTSIDKYEITFTGSNSFMLNNLTTNASSGSYTFTAGTSFNLIGGLAVSISGTAVAGDKFRFSVSENAARLISVSSTVVNDSRKIAAGQTVNGDGNNALSLGDLQTSLLFDATTLAASGSGSFTFDEFYNALVSTVGIRSFSARSTVDQQEGIMLQLDSIRESTSGVSIDEEMINMLKFQQAFNASARVITTVQELMDTLVNRT